MSDKRIWRAVPHLVLFFMLTRLELAHAFPWDIDMAAQPSLKSNEVARSPAEGTIPIGREPFMLTVEEAAERLENPVPASKHSVWRGRRLWDANCLTCHGRKGIGDGPVGPAMAAPDLITDFYRERTDGRIFGVVQLGGVTMPRYGYKFSSREIWDVVNYLRFLQGQDVKGIPRPD